MVKLNFQHHYFSPKCHKILHKSVLYAELAAQETFSIIIKDKNNGTASDEQTVYLK